MTKQPELEKLDDLAKKSARVLYRTRTVFPFDFYPSELVIDESKVSIVNKDYLNTLAIDSLLIEDIKSVTLTSSALFGSLILSTDRPNITPITINYLWKKDALEARRIIQGLMVINKEEIDTAQISVPDIMSRLTRIGRTGAS